MNIIYIKYTIMLIVKMSLYLSNKKIKDFYYKYKKIFKPLDKFLIIFFCISSFVVLCQYMGFDKYIKVGYKSKEVIIDEYDYPGSFYYVKYNYNKKVDDKYKKFKYYKNVGEDTEFLQDLILKSKEKYNIKTIFELEEIISSEDYYYIDKFLNKDAKEDYSYFILYYHLEDHTLHFLQYSSH